MPLLLSFVFFHIILSVEDDDSVEAWWPLLVLSVNSCHAALSDRFLIVYHKYGICHMYTKKIHRTSVFLFLAFILKSEEYCFCVPKFPLSLVAFSLESSLLRTFLKASTLTTLLLRTKEVDLPYFVQNLLFKLLAYMESPAVHLHQIPRT